MLPAENRRSAFLLTYAVCLALVLAISAVYAQVVHFDFLLYDDPNYLTENPYVKAGLTPLGIRWALHATVLGNWTPVTLLSHMLASQLFGLNSGMHHLVNVVFHALSAMLLFFALRRATGAPAQSGFVSIVFALHPLHVQSVAWIAERKDVLSGFFFFLALYLYVLYAEKPNLARYLAVLSAFALGLMSKPMLVTLPFVLLLFDVWPLRRADWPRIVWEKLPLFAVSAGFSVVTYYVQQTAGAVQATPLPARIENALVSYVTYLGQTLWPVRLAVFYPFPKSIEAWQAAGAAALLLGVSALAIRTWRRMPYFAVGWFWYFGMLVPVIGVVQVGSQSHADRYTYLPMVGLLLALAWGAADVVARWPSAQAVIVAAALVCGVLCIFRSSAEASYWQNSGALFERAIDVTADNWLAEGVLGQYLMYQPGRRIDAIDHLEAALRIEPGDAQAHNNLGICMLESGLCASAIPHFQAAIRAYPSAVQPLNNAGVCFMNTGDYAQAAQYFEDALRSNPGLADIHLNLGVTLSKLPGRSPDAIREMETALRLRPDYADAQFALGMLLVDLGRTQEAISHLEAGLRTHPDPGISRTVANLRAGRH